MPGEDDILSLRMLLVGAPPAERDLWLRGAGNISVPVDFFAQEPTEAQSTLNRIHANDALSRVHLGQEYETISTKFMAPMNSRMALAKLDNVALTRTTVDFNTKLSDFRTLYQQYEETMLRTIQTKCVDQPEEFYSSLLQAQSDRSAVRQSVAGLANLVTQYKQQVDALRNQAISASQQGDQ